MKLATTLLLFTLLGLSFASPSDSTSNLRRKLVKALKRLLLTHHHLGLMNDPLV
jgi:hypothetical protein